jgi:ATP adenylyltransferase
MPESELSDTLSRAFLSLLDLVISTVRHAPDYPAGLPSYNVLMTLDHMHMIPRRHEAYVLPETGERVLVNSLGFAGMLLLKREEQLQVVKREGVGKILRGVSVESVHDLQVDETSREAD